MIWLLGYVATIVAANIITAGTAPLAVWVFIIPWGTFLIGGTLVLRDAVQLRFGRRASYVAILLALLASAVTSRSLGDTLAITGASAAAFAFSEAAETEIFSRFRALLAARIFWSGTVSGLIDSALFVVLGLGLTGIVPWPFIPAAIVGQYVVKTAMVTVGAGVSLRVNQRGAVAFEG